MNVQITGRLAAMTRQLAAETQERISCSRRLLNPWWTLAGGADEDHDGQLILSVRDRLERGALDLAPEEVWARNGAGRTCIVCARVISPDQIENEVVVRTKGTAVALWAHLPCYNIWRWESATFAPTHLRQSPETPDSESI